jgi:hypothetical protein
MWCWSAAFVVLVMLFDDQLQALRVRYGLFGANGAQTSPTHVPHQLAAIL